MNFIDEYIRTREMLLNWILGVEQYDSLNPVQGSNIQVSNGNHLGIEIKNSINQFKSISMDPQGIYVDYQKLTQSSEYKSYCELVKELGSFDYRSFSSEQERLAFWINLYNTLVIDAVIQEEVQSSVIESRLGILSFFQKAAYFINGQRFSLTDIEHGVIRGNRGFPYFPGPHFASHDPRLEAVITQVDARIHFALNCASNSCPPTGVYTPENLETQLNLAAKNFINNDLVLEHDKNSIKISRIFNWYKVDFGGKKGILKFLIKNLNGSEVKEYLKNNLDSIRISYQPYDWGLNNTIWNN